MKIINNTHWLTRDIKRYLVACIEHEGLDPKDDWRITIYYTRRSNDVMGWAYYNSRSFRIGLPRRLKKEVPTNRQNGWNWKREGRPVSCGWVQRREHAPPDATSVEPCYTTRTKWEEIDELPPGVRERVLQVTLHELGHCKGLRHKDMANSRSLDTSFFDFNANPIGKQAKHLPRTREAAARDDLAHAEKNLATTLDKIKKTESYLKRLKTLRSKWRAEVRRAKQRKGNT